MSSAAHHASATGLEEAFAVGQDLQKAVSADQNVGQDSHDEPTWGLTCRSAIFSVEPRLRYRGPLSSEGGPFA